jgi:hypothetical protein
MAVRFRRRGHARRQNSAATSLIDDNDLLTPLPAEPFRYETRDDIRTAAGRPLCDDPYHFGWVLGRLRRGAVKKRERSHSG